MVTTGKVNLIEEFSLKQEYNDFIILSTFKFDPSFFDIYLIDKIFEKNPAAEIFILVDGNEYNKTYQLFTRHTGRAYHLIPVPIKTGVFHPKLSLFTSEKKATAYIGSCNLTLAGFTSNAELITKVESDFEETDSVVNDAILYYKKLLEKKVIQNKKLDEAISEISERVKKTRENKDTFLLHNLDEPILNQVMTRIKNTDKVTLLAPFWSQNPVILESINKGLKEVDICIQENNHNLSNPKSYSNYCEKHKIKLKFYHAKFDKNRIFHSKLMMIHANNPFMIAGSSNMTESALLKVASEGNYEVSVMIKENAKEILDEISLKEIENLDKISGEAIPFISDVNEKTPIIHFVDFDVINQNLTIVFDIGESEAELIIKYEDKTEETQKLKNQDKIEIHCQKIPYEIELHQNNLVAKRRIFYDEDYFYKKIAKGGINLTDINRRVSTDLRINALDILRLLNGLNLSLEKQTAIEDIKKHGQKQKEESRKFGMPSRELDTYHNRRLLESFVDLYKIICRGREEEKEREAASEEDDEKVKKISAHLRRIIDEDEERRKICYRILDSINDLLIYKASFEENKNEALLASCPLLIQSVIKVLSPIYIDLELIGELREIINDNLGGVSLNADAEARKYLYFNLVLLNHYFEDDAHYKFISKLQRIEDVFNEQFLRDCCEYIYQQMKLLNREDLADKEGILESIGYLASFIPDTRTVEDDTITSLKVIASLSKELWPFSKQYLETLLGMWSISTMKKDIESTISDFDEEKKTFIENLIKDK